MDSKEISMSFYTFKFYKYMSIKKLNVNKAMEKTKKMFPDFIIPC